MPEEDLLGLTVDRVCDLCGMAERRVRFGIRYLYGRSVCACSVCYCVCITNARRRGPEIEKRRQRRIYTTDHNYDGNDEV